MLQDNELVSDVYATLLIAAIHALTFNANTVMSLSIVEMDQSLNVSRLVYARHSHISATLSQIKHLPKWGEFVVFPQHLK